jgi:lipoic acid synthetase
VKAISCKALEIMDWGLLAYGEAFEWQLALVEDRIAGISPDRLVLVEHPHVITIGRSGGLKDLRVSIEGLHRRGVDLYQVDRGGMATFHGPGQLVAYPIIKLQQKDLHQYLRTLLQTVAAVLRNYGLKSELKEGSPGIWVASNKIASVGIAVRRWVTYHGIALNVSVDLKAFNWIIPCGHPGETITSMENELQKPIDLDEVKQHLIKEFFNAFRYSNVSRENENASKHSGWLRHPAPGGIQGMEKDCAYHGIP